MYLEERIEQVERQSESTARAVAELTVDVRAIRRDQTEGFNRVDKRLNKIEADVSKIEADVGKLKDDVGKLKDDVGKLKDDVGKIETDVNLIKQMLEVVLTRLPEK